MITTQADLDRCLDRVHVIQVEISPNASLPMNRPAYRSLLKLPQQGFSLTPRRLLHAIGCKTAALPKSEADECLKAAWLYTYILDLEGPHLSFQGTYGSDLQTPRSQEVGIGIMCLMAESYFGIPWDQLESLPGQGMRFDYRGTNGSLECIFESKGTSHHGNQRAQINNGLKKKAAHHARGEHFDVELIISSCISRNGEPPRILLGDPEKSSLRSLYELGDNRYFRLRHYCRVLQYIGLPRSAFNLTHYTRQYLVNRQPQSGDIIDETEAQILLSIQIDGDEFVGRWFDSWLPENSVRYKRLYQRIRDYPIPGKNEPRRVFQGLRKDAYKAGLSPTPFSHSLIEKHELEKYKIFDQSGASVFPDGTVMVFHQD